MVFEIHHAQITIPKGKEDKAREFYCELLGLSEIPKPQTLGARGGFWMEVGNIQLHVGVEDNDGRANTKAHLAYLVEDLRDWRACLEAHNIKVIDGISIPDFERFEFRDPFGNRIEFLERK